MKQRQVAIIAGARTPFVKSMTHYIGVTNQDLLTAAMSALVEKCGLKGQLIGDVITGSVMNHPYDWNLAREVAIGAQLAPETPGMNIQRACGTGLEAANLVALKIASGQIESGIAGGSDTNSDIPLIGSRELTKFLLQLQKARSVPEKLKLVMSQRPHIFKPQLPVVKEPRTGLSMGEHCELMVKDWQISRDLQDELAYESHQKAVKAYEEGFFDDHLISFGGLSKDTIPRKETSLEKLRQLRPAFDTSGNGSLSAGNSTPLTDGASAVLLGSPEWARRHQLEEIAYLNDTEVGAVDFVAGAGLLIGPTVAVARLLKRHQLKLQDFDYYEIHEAFAGQVLCTLKAWESDQYCQNVLGLKEGLGSIDRSKMNVKGGSLAVGHPFAATGGRILLTAAKLLKERGNGRVLVSICTAGGMGVAAIVER